ncbi:MAG: MFS transporter [Opitutae bacterium]|nr:MFS transporter [Opitutae bacterium]
MSSAPERLSFREKFAYGLGDTASNFYFALFNGFLVYYYTDVFGLTPAAAGSVAGLVPTFVSWLIPLIGILADRTHTRWGQFRPYLLWGALPYGVCGYLMFSNPTLSPSAKIVFAYATYALTLIAYLVINTPYSALMGVMSPSSAERTGLSAYRFACAFTGGLIIGTYVPWLKDHFGANEADSFSNMLIVFATVSVAMFLYTFWNTRERVAAPASAQQSVWTDLRDLSRNAPWLILFFAGFLTLANVGLRAGATVYYFKYIVGDDALRGFDELFGPFARVLGFLKISSSGLGLYNFAGGLAFIIGSLCTKLFLRFFPRRPLMIWLTILNALAMAAFYVADPHNLAVLAALNIFASFVAGPTPAIVWSFYADTADYGEWKFHRRSTGLVFSAAVLAQKIGLALGTALLGWLLSHYGYVANAVQTPRAISGIYVVFAVLPGTFALLSGLAIFFYRLDDPTVKQIEQDLAARKAAAEPVEVTIKKFFA